MKKYQKINVYSLDHHGRGIAKVDDKITFITNALPDELVDIEITKDSKKIYEAEVLNYIKKSPLRINAQCPYYEQCGGCDLMHISYEKQLKYKEQKVIDIMARFANINSDIIKSIIGTSEFNYRNKATLQVKEKVGYYKKKSYDIVPINNCLIADSKINKLINLLYNIPLNNIKQVIIKVTLDDTMIIFDIAGNIDEQAILKIFNNTNIIIKDYNNYKVLKGNNYIIETLGNYKFYISPESFFQVNTNGALNLYNKALEYANLKGNEKVLDLYCGTGTIGIFLARHSKEVIGIEINEQAIKDANKNKEINELSNIEFICGDTGTVIKEKNFKPDIVVVDPPRSGLNTETIQEIIKINAHKIVYISCDPMTLARDLKILSENYNIIEVTPVDMFPNTHHVECVVLLQHKKDYLNTNSKSFVKSKKYIRNNLIGAEQDYLFLLGEDIKKLKIELC
jgi:23S rRNA (uracil1939-C5)-methyltransferase